MRRMWMCKPNHTASSILAATAVVLLAFSAQAADPCPAGNLVICNMQIPMQGNPIGFKAIMTVPPPYVHDTFTVECLGSTNGSFGYSITDDSQITCKLATCPALSVNVCGFDIPTPGGTVEGDKVQLQIPPRFVTPSAMSRHPTITATCSDVSNQPRYTVKERGGSSCADFACSPTNLSICDTFINIPDYGENGAVKEMTMPPPFEPGKFQVQCLARNDKPPAYEIIEQKDVVCKKQ